MALKILIKKAFNGFCNALGKSHRKHAERNVIYKKPSISPKTTYAITIPFVITSENINVTRPAKAEYNMSNISTVRFPPPKIRRIVLTTSYNTPIQNPKPSDSKKFVVCRGIPTM